MVLVHLVIQFLALSSTHVYAEPFARTILASGYPYYKILMSLGTCHKALLFQDQKIWTNQRLNRVLDIYYKSDNPTVLVSRVELQVVINNTDCFAYSTTGVGHAEFIGTLLLPSNSGLIFYNLMIFTCSAAENSFYCLKHMLQFYINPQDLEKLYDSNETILHEADHKHDGHDHQHKLCQYKWLAEDVTEVPDDDGDRSS